MEAALTRRRAAWGAMTVLAVMIATYAGAVAFVPGFGPEFVQAFRKAMPAALYAHLSGGTLALAVGPWQFNRRLRTRAVNLHRWMGRTYVVAVMVGGLGALSLAPYSQHGLASHLGFGALAAAWLLTTAMAYREIRRRNVARHRVWMIRSLALTLAAVTLRIYLPLSQVAGIPFPLAYQVVAWLCWVPNLLAAEVLLVRRPAGGGVASLEPFSLR